METLDALQRRIDVAEGLRDLVRTMKTLAAVSVRHHERSVAALAEYAETVELGLRALLRERPPPPAPRRAPTGRTGLLVIGSDQGMCGTFNEQVVARVRRDLDAAPGGAAGVRLHAVGARVEARLVEAGLTPEATSTMPLSTALLPSLVQDLLLVVEAWRAAGDLDGVALYHNVTRGHAGSHPHRQVLLPITPEHLRALGRTPWPTPMLPMHTVDRAVLLAALTRQHLLVTLHRALVLSLAAEHAGRLVAMQAAERNIDEQLGGLRARYHQQRQTAITTELLDIVAGVEALSGRAA